MADKDKENIDVTSTEEVDAKEAVLEESSPEEPSMEDTESPEVAPEESAEEVPAEEESASEAAAEEESVTDESLVEDQSEEETVPVTTDEKTPSQIIESFDLKLNNYLHLYFYYTFPNLEYYFYFLQ